ncbi:MAG: (d)CMP kinase [Planctomycetota bacterium]|nr:MAG: (d)CMP kinase [Planctomycetota bacterium]
MARGTLMATASAQLIRFRPEWRVPQDQSIIITIDGPAGTGKSTIARLLAHRLGLDFLDTGAMYRAAAAICIDHQIDPDDVEKLCEVVADADLHFDWQTDPPAMLAWLKPIDSRIRDADVTALVSRIAAIGKLREHMVRKQRIIAAQHPRLVAEGRDQGSIVFPDADVKFYLDASPRIRAHRRAEQLRAEGAAVEDERILEEIIRRDTMDASRQDGPLICPDDAIVIDSSNLEIPEVIAAMETVVRERVQALRMG